MDKGVSEKIKSVLDGLRRKALNAFRLQIREIYTRGDYAQFIPESMVREAVRVAGGNMRQLIADAEQRVSGISVSPGAFKLFDAAMHSHLTALEDMVAQGNGASLMGNLPKVAADQFETVRAEMLRSLDLHRPSFTEPKNKGGRPPEWDWEGALAAVSAAANTPDGLSADRGGLAEIERIISGWFIAKKGDSPAISEIRKRANKVIKELKINKAGN
jgi:hypothetical protein